MIYDVSVKEVAICLRYAYRRVIDRVEGRLQRKESHDFVDDIAEFFKAFGFHVNQEFCTSFCGLMICGKIDVIHPVHGMVIEIKLVRNRDVPKRPIETHLRQLAGYLFVVPWAKYGELIYVSEVSGRVTWFPYPRRVLERWIRDFAKRLTKLRTALELRNEPEPEPSLFCTRCPYRKECFRRLLC